MVVGLISTLYMSNEMMPMWQWLELKSEKARPLTLPAGVSTPPSALSPTYSVSQSNQRHEIFYDDKHFGG